MYHTSLAFDKGVSILRPFTTIFANIPDLIKGLKESLTAFRPEASRQPSCRSHLHQTRIHGKADVSKRHIYDLLTNCRAQITQSRQLALLGHTRSEMPPASSDVVTQM